MNDELENKTETPAINEAPAGGEQVGAPLDTGDESAVQPEENDGYTAPAQEAAEADEPPMTRKQRVFRAVRNVICLISAIAFIVSGGIVLKRGVDYYKMKQVEADVFDLTVPDETVANIDSRDPAYLQALIGKYPHLASIQFPRGFNYKYALLYAANQDFAGYLTIPGTSIDTAVVKHGDNEYYYDHDFYKNESKYGAVFANAQNNMVVLDQNTVIIGHHMRDGSRFHDLVVYKTMKGYKKSPVIGFNTPYGNYQWKVYGAFILNGGTAGDNGYKLDCFFQNVSQANFAAYIYEIGKRTLYTTGVDLLPTDKILTLMTCTYEFDNARLLVIARMVRDGEDASVDLSGVKAKSEPIKYPQAYYDKRGKANPYVNDIKWYPN